MKSYNNGQVLSGNTNNMEIKYNQLDILTNKIASILLIGIILKIKLV